MPCLAGFAASEGLTYSTVTRLCSRGHVASFRRVVADETLAVAQELLLQGKSQAEAAAYINYTYEGMSALFRRETGLPPGRWLAAWREPEAREGPLAPPQPQPPTEPAPQ